MQCWFAPEYILIAVSVQEQGRAGSKPCGYLPGMDKEQLKAWGLPPCSHMTLCGRRFGRVWLSPQERHERQTGEQPVIWFLLGTALPFTTPALLPIPSDTARRVSLETDRWPSAVSPYGNCFDLYFHLLARLLSCPWSGVWLHLSA